MLDLNNISPSPGSRKKTRKRVGRGPGSGNGKTSGRGHKGQKARSGYSRRLGFEGGQMPLMRRLPKRGFHHESRHPYAEVNLYLLESHFDAGEEVTPERVWEKGLAKKRSGGVKVLGDGEITKALKLKVNAITGSARVKVEKAGGSVDVLEAPAARAAKQPRKGKTTK